jgi:hypothetical protein
MLLIAEAVVVGMAGLALLLIPSMAVSVAFRSSLNDSVGTFVGRVAGATLFTLGIICWMWRNSPGNRTRTGLAGAMLFYDTALVVVLLSAPFSDGLSGAGRWPAIAIRLGLGT